MGQCLGVTAGNTTAEREREEEVISYQCFQLVAVVATNVVLSGPARLHGATAQLVQQRNTNHIKPSHLGILRSIYDLCAGEKVYQRPSPGAVLQSFAAPRDEALIPRVDVAAARLVAGACSGAGAQ